MNGDLDHPRDLTGAVVPLPWSLSANLSSLPPKRSVVSGMICAGEVAGLVAPPFAGKSIITAKASVDLMADRPFLGRAVAAGSVLYVAAEREGETRLRIGAMRDGGPDVPVLGRSAGVQMDLRDPAFVSRLRATMSDVEDATGQPLRLLVLDTLARMMPGSDEISAREMGAVADALSRLADAGPAVLVLHHPAKSGGGGLRGSGALDGAVDRILELRPGKAGSMVLRVAQANSGPEGLSVSFRIVSTEIDRDDHGEPITVAVAQDVSAADLAGSSAKNSRTDALIKELTRVGGRMLRPDLLEAMRANGALSHNRKSSAEQLRQALSTLKSAGTVDYNGEEVIFQDQ